MKHGRNLKKLNRTSTHRNAMLKNMATSLFKHERIKTTLPKAKVLRSFAEKLITQSRTKSLNTIRYLSSIINDSEVVHKLLEDIGPRFLQRAGGYTRIYKFGFRYGDSAPMAMIELVDKKEVTASKLQVKKTKSDDAMLKQDSTIVAVREKLKSAKPTYIERGPVKKVAVSNKSTIRKSLKGSSSSNKGG